MLRLLEFLSNYRSLIVFLLLEAISIFMIVRFNNHHRHILGDGVLHLSGRMQEKRANVKSYFSLQQENRKLIQENMRLQTQLTQTRKLLDTYQGEFYKDSCEAELYELVVSPDTFEYIACSAIKQSIEKNYNYITINKGSAEGVKVDAGLVSPQGIAGRVVRVGKHYSLAMSALNLDFKLSARILNNNSVGALGPFEWNGKSTRHGYLNNIPLDVEMKEGDTIVTSGHSVIFPEGFIIGVIDQLETPTAIQIEGAGFHEARVKLATDFYSLKNLYIVNAIHKATLDSLETDMIRE